MSLAPIYMIRFSPTKGVFTRALIMKKSTNKDMLDGQTAFELRGLSAYSTEDIGSNSCN